MLLGYHQTPSTSWRPGLLGCRCNTIRTLIVPRRRTHPRTRSQMLARAQQCGDARLLLLLVVRRVGGLRAFHRHRKTLTAARSWAGREERWELSVG